jgi:hypothetical protein
MDVDVALENVRRAMGRIHAFLEMDDHDLEQCVIESDLDALLEHWGTLDGWLCNGGFLPTEWQANVRHS